MLTVKPDDEVLLKTKGKSDAFTLVMVLLLRNVNCEKHQQSVLTGVVSLKFNHFK